MSDGVTKLRINMDTGASTFGSGQPGAPQPEGEYAPESFHGVKPYASMTEFIAETQTPEYKGNALDPRKGEAYRRNAELRLAAMTHRQEVLSARSAPAENDYVGRITELNPGLDPAFAAAAIRLGGFVNTEMQVAALREAQAQNSPNAMALYEARVTLSMLEGR